MLDTFTELNKECLYDINGGEKTLSDWMLFGSALCGCFVCPQIGVPVTVALFIFT